MGRVLKRQPPQLEAEADPHHQSQLTGLDRLAPRTSLGSVVPPISLSTVKTLALSSSSKPMLSMVALDAALQETIFFMSFSYV